MDVRQTFLVVALLPIVSVGLTEPAFAQTSACDRLKASLAARIDPGRGPFTLEAVPAADAAAGGGKVIGSCEGGAMKIVLRRGAAPATVAAPSAPAAVAEVARPPMAAVTAVPQAAPDVATDTRPPVQVATPAEAPSAVSSAPQAAGLVDRFGHWALGALLLVLATWLGMRLAYRRAYDEAGLPRGPKLN
jgi:hypothetical protein